MRFLERYNTQNYTYSAGAQAWKPLRELTALLKTSYFYGKGAKGEKKGIKGNGMGQ